MLDTLQLSDKGGGNAKLFNDLDQRIKGCRAKEFVSFMSATSRVVQSKDGIVPVWLVIPARWSCIWVDDPSSR